MDEVDLKSKIVWASGLRVEGTPSVGYHIFDPDTGQAYGQVNDEDSLVVFALGYMAGVQKAVRRKE